MPMIFNGRQFVPNFQNGPFMPMIPQGMPPQTSLPDALTSALRDPRIPLRQVSLHVHDPRDLFRQLPRYGVGTDRISELNKQNDMKPHVVRHSGRGKTYDPVAQAVAKMAQSPFQDQFFNRLMLGD